MPATNKFTGTISNNWSDPNNWTQSATPFAGDGFITMFDITSPNCDIDVPATCDDLDFTSYNQTINWLNDIECKGNTIRLGLNMSGTSITNGIVYNNNLLCFSNNLTIPFRVKFSTGNTFTLGDPHTFGSYLYVESSGCTVHNNIIRINNGGVLDMGGFMTGTTDLAFGPFGGSTWQGTGILELPNVRFEDNSGTTVTGDVTIGNNVNVRYVNGTVTTTGSTLNLLGSTTTFFDTFGMRWYNILVSPNCSVHINSPLDIDSLLLIQSTANFLGVKGFRTNIVYHAVLTTASPTVTLSNGIQYDVDQLLIEGTSANQPTWQSDLFGSTALLRYTGVAQSVIYATFTDIDASLGVRINDLYNPLAFTPTLTNTSNILLSIMGTSTPATYAYATAR